MTEEKKPAAPAAEGEATKKVVKAKPKTAKGTYIKSAYLSSTMGPGVKLDISRFVKEAEEAD